MSWVDEVKWDEDGLVPAIAQAENSRRVLTLAWMNREALHATVAEKRAVYWSRSRKCLWRKGEESGYIQQLNSLCIDCDGDAILLIVEQVGGIACHTGRESCFFRTYQNNQWEVSDKVLKDPADIYGRRS
tara:strand:+ start:1279 stop:1668 length:390 start_codon:yes stop_codon:yes gene_type:complete